MKLYIQQKFFSWKDKFFIKDKDGNDRYYVEGELFTLGKKLHIYDMNGGEVAFIQQKVLSFLPKFFVFVGDTQVAEIVKEFTLFKNKYRIDGLNWEVHGNFLDHDYEIVSEGRTIATVAKEWLVWKDAYELNVHNASDTVLALSVVLAIDCVLDMQQRAAASN